MFLQMLIVWIYPNSYNKEEINLICEQQAKMHLWFAKITLA